MRKALATTLSIVAMISLSATMGIAQTSCPAEVASAKAMLTQTAQGQDVQAPRSLAGVRSQDIQSPRSQDIQSPRGRLQEGLDARERGRGGVQGREVVRGGRQGQSGDGAAEEVADADAR